MRNFSRLTALVLAAFLCTACGGLQATVLEDPTYHEEWDDRVFDFEKCRMLSGCRLQLRSG
jgi:hypothetical protein